MADELPDVFLDRLRQAVKAEKEDALLLGEVWEDATNKVAYSERRRYLLGDQLDCVMNYPFADAIIRFVREGGSEAFFEVVESICANYPPQALHLLMNHIGTHDTPRAITALAGKDSTGKGRPWQSTHALSAAQYALGIKRMKLATLLQFTLPGVPSIYYGDEIGMQGYSDPFNRRFFDWKHRKQALLEWYKALGSIRSASSVLADGFLRRIPSPEGTVCYVRQSGGHEMLVAVPMATACWKYNVEGLLARAALFGTDTLHCGALCAKKERQSRRPRLPLCLILRFVVVIIGLFFCDNRVNTLCLAKAQNQGENAGNEE